MATVQIKIRGLAEATGAVRAAIVAGGQAGLAAIAARGQALVQQNIQRPPFGSPVVASGVLLSSIAFELRSGPGMIGSAVVFAQPPGGEYAGYVEAGTGPHFPPPSALLLWVKKRFGASNDKEALSIAFAVARKIRQRGTLARGMFAAAFRQLSAEIGGIFERAIAAAIGKLGAGK